MRSRNLLHLGFLLPIFLGIGVFSLMISQSDDYPIQGSESSIAAIPQIVKKIVKAFPLSEMPVEYDFSDYSDDGMTYELDEQRGIDTNSYVLLTALVMLVGLFGIGLVGAAKTGNESRFNPILRTGAIVGIAGFSTAFLGFNLAFPGGMSLFELQLGLPRSVSPKDYGREGMLVWTDVLFFSTNVALLGVLIITVTCAGQTGLSAFSVAIPVVCFVAPFVVSWKWGGGWLDVYIHGSTTYDFAGAALFHWHAGVVVLTIAVVMKMFSRANSVLKTAPNTGSVSWFFWVPGIVLYALVVLAMNAGSTLIGQPSLIVAVIKVSGIAGGVSLVLGAVAGLFLNTRHSIEWAGLGLIAGMVSVSANADLLDLPTAIGTGAVAGILSTFVIYAIDRFIGYDPLGVFGVHGVAGAASVLLAKSQDSFEIPIPINPMGQVVMLVVVPILSFGVVAFVAILYGVVRLLFVRRDDIDGMPPRILQ